MIVSIREAHLPGIFGNIKAGLDALGLEHVELEYFHERMLMSLDQDEAPRVSVASASELSDYAARAKDLGVKCSAILLHNKFGVADLDAEMQWVIDAARTAAALGARTMRIDAKMIEGTLEERTDHFAWCMNKILDATSDLDLEMGIENHGKLGNEQDFLDLVTDKVANPRLGVTIDTANFYWYGYPVSEVRAIIEHLAPKCKHTHCKNIKYPADRRDIKREMGWEYGTYTSSLRDGDIDMRWLVGLLAKSGYKHDLCIENESLHRCPTPAETAAVLKDDADYLKEIVASL